MKTKSLFSTVLVPFFAFLILLFTACEKETPDKPAVTDPQLKSASSGTLDGGNNGGSIPYITSADVSFVDANTATAGGIASLKGGSPPITARGVVWGTYYFPTLENNSGFTIDGNGPGTFESKATGLTPGTVYYIRAYATNKLGTNYSTGESFAASTPVSGGTCPSELIDGRDGKVYHTIQIGQQCWMKENLNFGTRINIGTEPVENSTVEKYCYNNQEANCTTYGGLYSWDEMMQNTGASTSNPSGVQGICPDGWHIPSMAELTQLKISLGGYSVAGGKLKETGYSHWKKPNAGANNSSGFTGLGSGYVMPDGSFNQLLASHFWTTNNFFYPPQNKWYFWTMELSYMFNMQQQYHYTPEMGNSVRCIKNPD